MKRTAFAIMVISTLVVSLLLVADIPSLKAAYEAPQVQWEKTYGPYEGYSLVQTVDGGYAIAGQQAAFREFQPHLTSGWENQTALLIKVDASGNVEWTKTYGDEVGGGWTANSVVQTKDSGFAIVGLGFLIKTDFEGNIAWNTTITWSGSSTMECKGILTSDGGYLLAGSGINEESPDTFAWVLKTDENGNALWNKTFTIISDQLTSIRALAVAEADNDGYVVAGQWQQECWFAKTDVNGNLQWNQTYDITFNDKNEGGDAVTCIVKAEDGGYILGGKTNTRGFLIKTNSEGEMEWNRPYLDYSVFISIVTASSGNGYFAIGGFNNPSNDGPWFVRLDASGDLLWNSTFGLKSDSNSVRSVVKTSDGGYAVAGTLNSTVWLVKFAPEPPALPDNTSPPPEHVPPQFPTAWIMAGVITVVVGIGLIVYFKKRKH